MNGLRKCGIHIQWNFIQPQRRMKILSFSGKWMELETSSSVRFARFRSPKVACFLSYVEYKPNTNTVIL
jgi:hypothetical protein